MTTLTDDVRDMWTPWGKYGSRRACIAWLVSLDGCHDEETGSIDWDVWLGRIGRTVVSQDDRGFVDAIRYPTEEEAEEVMTKANEAYSAWEEG
jgi:hypothetical protein